MGREGEGRRNEGIDKGNGEEEERGKWRMKGMPK